MRQARPTAPEQANPENRFSRSSEKPIPQATLQPLHDTVAAAEQIDQDAQPLDPARARKKKSRSSSQPATPTN